MSHEAPAPSATPQPEARPRPQAEALWPEFLRRNLLLASLGSTPALRATRAEAREVSDAR
jgi:hypothetical protein